MSNYLVDFSEIAITKIGRLIVPALIKALSSSDDIHLRKAAAEQLGRMPWETNAENALIKALQDRNPLVVAYAAYALGEQRVKSVLGPLKIITKKESPFERRGAIWAITKIGSVESVTFLKEFTNDKDEYVRMIAKRALHNSGI
jgi:HEAT repeat protein